MLNLAIYIQVSYILCLFLGLNFILQHWYSNFNLPCSRKREFGGGSNFLLMTKDNISRLVNYAPFVVMYKSF